MFLLPLETDAARTSLNGHCARKSAVLVLEWCYKARGVREQDLWRYWLPERCIEHWCDKPAAYGCLSKECGHWIRVIAVSCNLAKHSDIQSENTTFKTLRFTPLTKTSIGITDNSLVPVLFLRSLNILSGSLIINICSCHDYMKVSWIGPMAYPHARFHYSKLLTHLCHIYR